MSDFAAQITVLNTISRLCSNGKVYEHFGKRYVYLCQFLSPAVTFTDSFMFSVSTAKRLALLEFIDKIDVKTSESDVNLKAFIKSFEGMVSKLQGKINSRLFDIVVRVGVKLKGVVSDKFWFALIVR
jgi:hypothetical protein